MKRKTPTQSYFLILLFFFIGCSILNKKQDKVFKVTDAYYQSWMISETEKGTTVFILISGTDKEVVFDSIIFRGIQMPAVAEIKDGTTVLSSTLNYNQSRIMDDKEVATEKPDQIIYRYKGKKNSYKLESIRREEMKYRK